MRARAVKPSLREIQERTKHAHGLLPGTRLRRAPLGRTAISDVLKGSIFPAMGGLMEWRQAIEPPAAALAARRPYAPACRDLLTLSRRLHELGDTSGFVDDTPAGQRIRADYEDVDARFHEALLEASGNEMFSAQRDPVREALSYRIRREWEGIYGPDSAPGGVRRFPIRPAPLSLWLHQALATAIAQAQAGPAMRFVRAIVAEVDSGTLPASEADELEGAPGQLDQRDADWEPFRHAIRAAVQSPRASAAMPGPVVVMGVAGCGKTTMGLVLAGALHVPYAEGDTFHSAGNRDRMARGIALTDAGRAAWLAAIASHLRQDARVVASCSALKRAYRDRLREAHPGTWFLHLTVNDETAAGRVAGRDDHYMPASLVGSQFAALEPLGRTRRGWPWTAASRASRSSPAPSTRSRPPPVSGSKPGGGPRGLRPAGRPG
ncbi:MAG TPA: gluconokinase, GntK/IdnK-type [Trebonia sp.]|nr:gluconokinase, GntK/IdnK-type [Trebonia sp.]